LLPLLEALLSKHQMNRKNINSMQYSLLLFFGSIILACSTPVSDFRVFQQSDGTIGVHAPQSANDAEAHQIGEAQCQKLGKRTATLVDSRKTTNDRFPYSYTFLCR
jgi:hypothetical protein